MSDFFYKEKLGPVFSPVIKVKRGDVPLSVATAIDNLLNPSGNMFTRAQTVKNLMQLENYSLEQTAKALSLRMSDVGGKLRLLEFSDAERAAVLEYGFSEKSALDFLALDKYSRLYAMEYCHKNSFTPKQIEGYVEGLVNAKLMKNAEKSTAAKKGERRALVGNIGFLFNSVDNFLRIARQAGFSVDDERSEDDEGYSIHIRIDKHKS